MIRHNEFGDYRHGYDNGYEKGCKDALVVIENIKAEIEIEMNLPFKDIDYYDGLRKAHNIIDKYISGKEIEWAEITEKKT